MGGTPSIPEDVKSMTTNQDVSFELDIVYCSGWGYYSMVSYAEECLKLLYPKAKINAE